MKKLILLLILLLASTFCFAQEDYSTQQVERQRLEIKTVIDIGNIVLDVVKESKITNKISDVLTDLYWRMYEDLVKKGFTKPQAFALMTMTFEQAEKVAGTIADK